MHPEASPPSRRVVFLFTSFPVLSETFLQREIKGFHMAGLPMDLVSLWQGEDAWNGLPVEKNTLLKAVAGILWLPYWLIRKPGDTLFFFGQLWRPRRSGLLNWIENLLGFSYALRTSTRWETAGVSHFHAVWASAPGMAAWALSRLSGIPFSVSGHAYDLYENGGDGWLGQKAGAADWIRTSTEAGRARWIEKGADPEKVIVVRRGLPELPPWKVPVPVRAPFRLLSVGRMVEKMGFDRQIPLFKTLKESGVEFFVEWIGDGPERRALLMTVEQAGLSDNIRFLGRLPYSEVEEAYRRNDIFVFTGRVDRRGDRAGLPNAVAEAMAHGLLVFATEVGAVSEAIQNEVNGFLWKAGPDPSGFLESLSDPRLHDACRINGREWIDGNYQLQKNLLPMIAKFRETPDETAEL